MNKETIEIERTLGHVSNTKHFPWNKEDSTYILDKLIEWSQNKNVNVYTHKIRTMAENIKPEKLRKLGEKFDPKDDSDFCDFVCYLDIYYQ